MNVTVRNGKFSLEDLEFSDPRIKYACAKQAILLSKENPRLLYPNLDTFVALLDGEKQILRWTALRVIGNLSKVDDDGKVDKHIPRMITFLNIGKMITAANAVAGLTEIVKNKPQYRNKIIQEMLKTEKYTYETAECRNVTIGNVIKSLNGLKEEIKDRKDVTDFLERQTKNTRVPVQKLSKKLLHDLTA